MRLRGKGVPTLRDKNVRGDHYVTLVVQVPSKLTAEQKELLEKFAIASGERGEAKVKETEEQDEKDGFFDDLKDGLKDAFKRKKKDK